MALTTSDWMLGAPSWNRCNYCGTETGAGRFDFLGRYQCDDCATKQDAAWEAGRLARVADEVAERAAMWGLDPL